MGSLRAECWFGWTLALTCPLLDWHFLRPISPSREESGVTLGLCMKFCNGLVMSAQDGERDGQPVCRMLVWLDAGTHVSSIRLAFSLLCFIYLVANHRYQCNRRAWTQGSSHEKTPNCKLKGISWPKGPPSGRGHPSPQRHGS